MEGCFPILIKTKPKEIEMIWITAMILVIVLIKFGLAFVLVKFGMLLMLVKLLLVGIKLSLFVIAGLALALVWRKFSQHKVKMVP